MASPFTPVVNPATAVANGILLTANNLVARYSADYMRAYNAVWANRQIQASVIVAELGTQAQALFTKSEAFAAFLNSQGASVPAAPPSWATVTFASDGSGSVTGTQPSLAQPAPAKK